MGRSSILMVGAVLLTLVSTGAEMSPAVAQSQAYIKVDSGTGSAIACKSLDDLNALADLSWAPNAQQENSPFQIAMRGLIDLRRCIRLRPGTRVGSIVRINEHEVLAIPAGHRESYWIPMIFIGGLSR